MKKKDQLGHPRFTPDETPVTYERMGYELTELCEKGKRKTDGSSASKDERNGRKSAGDEDRSSSSEVREKLLSRNSGSRFKVSMKITTV